MLAALAAGHRADRRDDALGDVGGDVERHPLAEALRQLDAAAQLVLALGTEPAQVLQPAVVDRRGQFGDRADAELAVELEGALGPERRDPGHLPDPVRHARAEVLELGNGAGLLKLDDLGSDRAADAGDLAQRGFVEHVDIAAVPGDRFGRLLVIAGAELVAASDLQQVGVLLQQRRDYIVGLWHICARPGFGTIEPLGLAGRLRFELGAVTISVPRGDRREPADPALVQIEVSGFEPGDQRDQCVPAGAQVTGHLQRRHVNGAVGVVGVEVVDKLGGHRDVFAGGDVADPA